MFNDLHLRSSQVVLIAKPPRVLVGIMHDRSRVAINFYASDVLSLVWYLTEEDRYKVKKNHLL